MLASQISVITNDNLNDEILWQVYDQLERNRSGKAEPRIYREDLINALAKTKVFTDIKVSE